MVPPEGLLCVTAMWWTFPSFTGVVPDTAPFPEQGFPSLNTSAGSRLTWPSPSFHSTVMLPSALMRSTVAGYWLPWRYLAITLSPTLQMLPRLPNLMTLFCTKSPRSPRRKLPEAPHSAMTVPWFWRHWISAVSVKLRSSVSFVSASVCWPPSYAFDSPSKMAPSSNLPRVSSLLSDMSRPKLDGLPAARACGRSSSPMPFTRLAATRQFSKFVSEGGMLRMRSSGSIACSTMERMYWPSGRPSGFMPAGLRRTCPRTRVHMRLSCSRCSGHEAPALRGVSGKSMEGADAVGEVCWPYRNFASCRTRL
mmetsp:Transcript_3390/g.6694  ORF Transcript_3390/g.6694 Transcript_3390/m.6694 type:complete len:308 (+) Transcript_3390:12543-13466(+)